MNNKRQGLSKIAAEIEVCKVCKAGKSGKAVPGEGNPDADIVFIGEAPGKNESLTGRPFVGRSGKLLRQTIRDILGLKEEDVFITSPVKYLPDSGTPSSSDIEHGKIHLEKQLKIIDPKIVVLLGRVAVEGVLQERVQVMKEHGRVIKKEGRKYFLTLHPAAVIRFQKNRQVFEKDFQKLAGIMKTMIR